MKFDHLYTPHQHDDVVHLSFTESHDLFGSFYIVHAVRGQTTGWAYFRRVFSCWCRFRTQDNDQYFWYNPEVKRQVAELLDMRVSESLTVSPA